MLTSQKVATVVARWLSVRLRHFSKMLFHTAEIDCYRFRSTVSQQLVWFSYLFDWDPKLLHLSAKTCLNSFQTQYSWIGHQKRSHKNNLPQDQEGYARSETTYEKLLSRRIYRCGDSSFVFIFFTSWSWKWMKPLKQAWITAPLDASRWKLV